MNLNNKNKNIAVLLTSHNRKYYTIECLENLFNQDLKEGYHLDVFLVIDGSTDGTKVAVSQKFSSVNIIEGDGNLFWNQGMRLAWKRAQRNNEYDFFIWLNDDTILRKGALEELLSIYIEATSNNEESIVVGACKDLKLNQFTYGGRDDSGPIIPNGKLQKCKYLNGNIVLISKKVFSRIGYLSKNYTHAMGDIDYGLRALKSGINIYSTKKYIAFCSKHQHAPSWCNPKKNIIQRWKNFNSPKGIYLKEYKIFIKTFWPNKYRSFILKAYLKFLFPKFYGFIKGNY